MLTRPLTILALAVCGLPGSSSWASLPPSSVFVFSTHAPGRATAPVPEGASRNTRRNASESSGAPDGGAAAQQIVATTNAFRHEHGRSALTANAQLLNAARYFAQFMAKTDQYGHAADGSEPAQRAQNFGYNYCAVAENIAYQFKSTGFSTQDLAQRFFEGWRNSPGHRKNMLDPDVTETAIAIARSAKTGRHYAVQLFGRPKSRTIEFSIENRTAASIEYTFDGESFRTDHGVRRTHQHCKQAELVLAGETLQPTNGQQFVLVNEQGRSLLQVR